MLGSILTAFSLYSRFPVPQAEWNEKNMRYCICFLPLVGAGIGAAQALMFFLLSKTAAGPVFRGALLAALPVFLSGGIHLDGFLDTCDAIHSYRDRQERLRILKDPHTGAFAILCAAVWFMLDLGIWSEASRGEIAVLSLCFVLSRSLSALTALTFPKARKDGMLRSETDPAAGRSAPAMAAVSVLAAAAMLLLDPVQGACAAALALAVLFYYRRMSEKMFGGITGDLSGWFTQTCELAMMGAVVLAARIPALPAL